MQKKYIEVIVAFQDNVFEVESTTHRSLHLKQTSFSTCLWFPPPLSPNLCRFWQFFFDACDVLFPCVSLCLKYPKPCFVFPHPLVFFQLTFCSTHTHTYTHIHTHIHTYTHTHIHTYERAQSLGGASVLAVPFLCPKPRFDLHCEWWISDEPLPPTTQICHTSEEREGRKEKQSLAKFDGRNRSHSFELRAAFFCFSMYQ